MSSPIILRRDADTINYLNRKQQISGLSLTMLNSIWKLKQQSYARRSTIMKLITGWNVDGSRYSLYTVDPQDKAKNAYCPLCMAIDSDLHWICECPCPALQEPREALLRHTIPQFIQDTLNSAELQYPDILPQLRELCRALQHGLLHHPQREHLWKGAWTQDLVTSLAYNARAHARSRPWRTNAAKTQLTSIIKSIGSLTTAYTLQAWKHRRRAAIQIHQQIQQQPHPNLYDHAPRLPHMDKIKYSDPILTDEQLYDTLQRIQRLNPTRPHNTHRTFGRRRLHQQPLAQPPQVPDISPPQTDTGTNQFTISLNHLPNQRITQSLLQMLPYCICCLCDQDHANPTCPPARRAPPPHHCLSTPRHPEDIDPAFPHAPSQQDWHALHWEVWHSPSNTRDQQILLQHHQRPTTTPPLPP
jgi:hypothetical protein